MFKDNYNYKKRSAKQWRERWHNHLDPSINKDPITIDEEAKIFEYYKRHGNKWAKIAQDLDRRYAHTTIFIHIEPTTISKITFTVHWEGNKGKSISF